MNKIIFETLRKLGEERVLSQKLPEMFVNHSTIAPNDGGGTVVTVMIPENPAK